MVESFTNEIQRKIDGFKENQLQVSMFMADDLERWLHEHDGKLLKVTDLVTGNQLETLFN